MVTSATTGAGSPRSPNLPRHTARPAEQHPLVGGRMTVGWIAGQATCQVQ